MHASYFTRKRLTKAVKRFEICHKVVVFYARANKNSAAAKDLLLRWQCPIAIKPPDEPE
jgi:hypothetical protein